MIHLIVGSSPLIPSQSNLPTHPATINGYHLTRNVAAGATSQEDNRAHKVLGFAPPTGRNTRHDPGTAVGVVDEGDIHIGVNVARGNRVHIDSLGDPLVGKRFGQLADATLRGSVGGDRDASLEGEKRGDVDNRTTAAGGEFGFIASEQVGAEFPA